MKQNKSIEKYSVFVIVCKNKTHRMLLIKNWIILFFSGLFFIIIGIVDLCGWIAFDLFLVVAIAVSTLLRLLFFIGNRKIIEYWVWYFFWEIIILIFNIIVHLFRGTIMIVLLLYSCILTGAIIDLYKQRLISKPRKSVYMYSLGILCCMISLFNIIKISLYIYLPAIVFIILGTGDFLLALKIRRQRKLIIKMNKLQISALENTSQDQYETK
ncbi:hypothetical protein CMV04_14830 [Elizabethkingia anophelis]|nr:hypothetical protein [Elizabethkingia anophelis]